MTGSTTPIARSNGLPPRSTRRQNSSPRARVAPREAVALDHRAPGQPPGDHLGCRTRHQVTVELAVTALELADQRGRHRGIHGAPRQVHRDVMALARIAHLGAYPPLER